jgi:glycosyltransferase involved in cell wall biosynthesis
MADKPLVSVLMTAYNREEFIAEAIESVFTCTYPNIEIVIVDDQSKDNTFSIIEQYAQKDQRIRYFRNEKNLGDYPNRNKAVSYAKGEYFTFLDSDDKMLPDGLSKCMEGMMAFPQAGAGMSWLYSSGEPFYLSSSDVVHEHFFKRQILVIGPGGTVIKRSFFQEIGNYPEKYGPANDMYFNLKLAAYSGIVLFPFKSFEYRLHDNQEKNNWYSYVFNNYLFLKDALEELPMPLSSTEKKWLHKKNKRRFLITLIRYFFVSRNLANTKSALKKTGFTFTDMLTAVFQRSSKMQ